MVAKLRPSSDCMAFSDLSSNLATDDERALNTTFPLDNRVRTSVKPSASKQFFSSGILAFMGLTPRRNATYLGMGFASSRCLEALQNLGSRELRPLELSLSATFAVVRRSNNGLQIC